MILWFHAFSTKITVTVEVGLEWCECKAKARRSLLHRYTQYALCISTSMCDIKIPWFIIKGPKIWCCKLLYLHLQQLFLCIFTPQENKHLPKYMGKAINIQIFMCHPWIKAFLWCQLQLTGHTSIWLGVSDGKWVVENSKSLCSNTGKYSDDSEQKGPTNTSACSALCMTAQPGFLGKNLCLCLSGPFSSPQSFPPHL